MTNDFLRTWKQQARPTNLRSKYERALLRVGETLSLRFAGGEVLCRLVGEALCLRVGDRLSFLPGMVSVQMAEELVLSTISCR